METPIKPRELPEDPEAKRLALGEWVYELREEGRAWRAVTEAVGVSETTGRKLLKEETERRLEAAKAERSKAKGGSGRYLKLTCGCGDAIRTSKTVAEKAAVGCAECGKRFTAA